MVIYYFRSMPTASKLLMTKLGQRVEVRAHYHIYNNLPSPRPIPRIYDLSAGGGAEERPLVDGRHEHLGGGPAGAPRTLRDTAHAGGVQ